MIRMPSTEPWASITNVKLDKEDAELLDRCVEAEKLPKIEIFRRALRVFAKQTLQQDDVKPVTDTSVAS